MATAVARSRIQDLLKLRAAVYNHSYNPNYTRTGSKVLRQRLKGPILAEYYPRYRYEQALREMQQFFSRINPTTGEEEGLETFDDLQAERVDDLAITKARGKGAPKKKRSTTESKKFGTKKKRK